MSYKEKLRLRQLSVEGKRLTVRTLTLVAFIVLAVWLLFVRKDNSLGLEVNRDINVTPEQIQSIKEIGQWEFLTVSDEELVDTVRRRLLGSDELVRIYYGTLRLGIDMRQVGEEWLKVSGDSVEVTLPPVGLLDDNFIDEARTQSFYETGSWSPKDRGLLYHKAHRMMKTHCLTPANLAAARQNGEAQVRQLMNALGFRHVEVNFGR